MMAPWAAAYVGIPYADHGRDTTGVDCWGLVRMVLDREFGVQVACMGSGYPSTDARDVLDGLITRNLEDVMMVDALAAVPGDVLFFRQMGHVSHCGIVVGDGMMLHAREGADVVVERYTSGLWANRLHGAFRHADLT